MSTLLGPEETGVMSQDIECREALAATSDRASMMAVWIYRLRAGTARILRTAQWTRASSSLKIDITYVVSLVVHLQSNVAKFLRAHGGCLGTRSR